MRKMALLALAIALLSATTAEGQILPRDGTVLSGRPLKLHFAYSVNPDCSLRGRPTIRITRAPEHGRVTVTQAMDFPNFPTSNIRSVCNTRRVGGTAIIYVSQRGFVGTDNVQDDTIFPDGHVTQHSSTITVIP
jgi:hypothetical protein